MTTIGKYAFFENNLTKLEIPASVESIGSGAFGVSFNLDGTHYNDKLKFIKYMGDRAMFDTLGSDWYESNVYAKPFEEYEY